MMMLLNGAKVEVIEASQHGQGATVRFLEDCYLESDEPNEDGQLLGYHFKPLDVAYVPISALKPCNPPIETNLFEDSIKIPIKKSGSDIWFRPAYKGW